MLTLVEYVGGYGWHVGRVFTWLLLLVFGAALTFVLVVGGQIACAVGHWPAQYSLPAPFLVPLVCGLVLRRRLARKFAGEPFVVNLPRFIPGNLTPWLVSRGHRHFRALVMIEVIVWASAIAAQLAIAIAPIATVFRH